MFFFSTRAFLSYLNSENSRVFREEKEEISKEELIENFLRNFKVYDVKNANFHLGCLFAKRYISGKDFETVCLA